MMDGRSPNGQLTRGGPLKIHVNFMVVHSWVILNRYLQSVFRIWFIEPIKLAIQELGGDAVWMGTESSTFFGLYPELGCTVFLPSSNGYRYYQYSQSSFQNGSARYIKNQWKLHPVVGSNSDKKAFIGNLLYAGKFSEKRKTNFKGRRINN
jgi:hypothetical protein